ncbi:MAG: hypothetical protein MJE68_10480 [Proteobacteria bacterium]|nr:hypothetical protein [Pseudomonadota bacterium]
MLIPILLGDDEYDKENRYLTTPKSTKGSSRKRVYSDEDEFNYPKRKERTLKRLVIPEDDYWSSTQSAPTTSVIRI